MIPNTFDARLPELNDVGHELTTNESKHSLRRSKVEGSSTHAPRAGNLGSFNCLRRFETYILQVWFSGAPEFGGSIAISQRGIWGECERG